MTMISSVMCLTVAAIFASASATDYCNLKSCTDQRQIHTMCKYSSPQPSTTCGKVTAVGLSDSQKSAAVRKHNELRRRVASGKETRGINGPQPPAANMQDLVWNNELAEIAQRWANQCAPGHDGCRNVERFQVGQNMAMTASTGENTCTVEDLIQKWYDEVDLFDKNQVPKLTNINRVGHYTQLVWAKTKELGCGLVKYRKSDGWNTCYLICNYGPAGNIFNYPIYEIKK